jgi:hypothetical protein
VGISVYPAARLHVPDVAFPANPSEGDLFYETDTDKLWAYNGSAWVEMGRTGAWTDYTAASQAEQGVALTTTIGCSTWTRFGRTIVWSFALTIASAGTAGQGIQLIPPVASAGPSFAGLGCAQYYDAAPTPTRYVCAVERASSTRCNLVHDTGGGSALGGAPAVTAANGDALRGQITYEASAST